ncbi:pyridoxal phosphate-dependent aminotransferase [Ruminococcaceae bacterium OttesenSCG-928-L11]|nr:pyridoxal phosphate-dependent aminotransferase [Ruminococcaceae bacterium OttesenSCG-928-L11]
MHRNITKSKRLQQVRYDIKGKITTEAERMEDAGIPIIKLNTGNPAQFGFETPASVVNSLERQLPLSAAYSQSRGLWEAREAIVAYSRSKGIPDVRLDRVYTGNGVSEMILMSMQALLNPGDEILVPMPDYPLWTAAVRLSDGKAVHYRCDEASAWFPDVADIRAKVTARTRGIVIINPNNPTGALYPDTLLRDIVQIAEEHGLMLFSDEIYDRLVMDGLSHTSTAALAGDVPVITYNGLSKSHQICGYRCGWMTVSGGGEGLREYLEGLDVLSSMRLCSNVLSQSVIKAALSDSAGTDRYIQPGGRLYEQRQCAWEGLNRIPGVSVLKSRAGLYMFPRLDLTRHAIYDDEQFVLDFLREKHVLLTHGTAYQWEQPDHFRIVYLPEVNQLRDVVERLGDFLETYSQSPKIYRQKIQKTT